jgi:hypothetical protein
MRQADTANLFALGIIKNSETMAKYSSIMVGHCDWWSTTTKEVRPSIGLVEAGFDYLTEFEGQEWKASPFRQTDFLRHRLPVSTHGEEAADVYAIFLCAFHFFFVDVDAHFNLHLSPHAYTRRFAYEHP